MNTNRMVKAAGFIMVASVLSKILGLGREMSIAAAFGATRTADAYYVALAIPAVLFAIVGAAITTIFIPIFTEYRKKDEESFTILANSTLNAILLVVGILAILGMVFTPLLVKLIAPGFSGADFELTVSLTRILLPAIILMGINHWSIGFLHSKQHFFAPALIGIPYNIIIITIVFLSAAAYGVYGLAIGTLIAISSQFLIQMPALKREGFEYRRILDWQHPGLKKATTLIVPVILGTGATQLSGVVDRILASNLTEGSIAALNYASRVNGLPHGLFTIAIITVMYPTLSDYAAEGDLNRFMYTLRKGMKSIAFIVLPTMVGLVILREEIVRLLFERGNFTPESTAMTAFALGFYALGLLAMGWKDLLAKAFFSLKDTKTPMYVGIGVVSLNIVLSIILVRYLAHGGLALATAIALTVGALTLLYLLRHKLGSIGGREVLSGLVKMIILSSLMAILLLLLKQYIDVWVGFSAVVFGNWVYGGALGQAYQLTVYIILAGAFYFSGARLMGLEEAFMMRDIFIKGYQRLKRR